MPICGRRTQVNPQHLPRVEDYALRCYNQTQNQQMANRCVGDPVFIARYLTVHTFDSFFTRLFCHKSLRPFVVVCAVATLLGYSSCQRKGERPAPGATNAVRTDSTRGSVTSQAEPPSAPPAAASSQQGPTEFDLVQTIIHGTSDEQAKVPAETAEIIRGLLAARARLEFDLDGRLIGVDLAGERRSGSDQEIALAVRLPHLKRLRIAGFGVTPEGIKQLTTAKNLEELALENTQIDDAGLETLKDLPRLWSLNLRRSVKLTDHAIEVLAGFPRLTHLYLLENQFSSEALTKLVQINGLRLLDLRGCGAVNAELLGRLSSMEHLVALRLRGYNVDDNCVQAVSRFSHLTSFTLEESPAGNVGLAALAQLPLESLTLFRCNAINDEGLKIVSRWKKLRSLSLRDMAIRGDFFTELAGLPSLRTLSAVQTMVADAALQHLVDCPQLEELALAQTLVTDNGLEAISRLTNLKRLDLAQTPISDQGLAQLANLKQLEWLNVSGNPGVTDQSTTVLLNLPELKEVYLDGTSMTQDGLAKLGSRARTVLALEE